MVLNLHGVKQGENRMPNLFNTEQEANEYKEKHQLFGRVPEYIEGTGKWGLVFPLKAHVTVIPHVHEQGTPQREAHVALYEAALDKRASAGFIRKHEAVAWMRQIATDRKAVETEANEWGISVEDVNQVCARIFQKHQLIQ